MGIVMHQCKTNLTRIVAFSLALFAGAGLSAQPFTEPNESQLQTHQHYINRAGETVHSPSKTQTGDVPQGATAQCRDGSYSFSHHHSGTVRD
jgi:Protein of unknown function (DUF3761)